MPQRVLTTQRLVLLPLADDHLEHEVELDSDPEVLRYLRPRASTRTEVERAHARRMERGRQVDGLGFWAGFLRDGGQGPSGPFVGWWVLAPPHGPDQPVGETGVAELGYRLRHDFWRQGLASGGSRELLRHGFEDLRVDRVIAQTMAVNTGSRAVMESVGMRFVRSWVGEWAEAVAGAEHGEVEYAVTRREWDVLHT